MTGCGRVYRQEISQFAQGATIVTDTYPAIISYVGRIATAIPNARFIFMSRDHDDLALRIFMKHYRSGNHYAYNIKTIFEHLSWYRQMTDLWLDKLGPLAIAVGYGDMIEAPNDTLRRVAELCGRALPEGGLPDLGDDRDCAKAYRGYIAAALA